MKRLGLILLLSALAAAQSNPRLPSYKDLKYPQLPQVKIPDPVEITLSNGMRVFLLENHELPLISGLAMIRTGNLFDPKDKKGLADATAEVLRSGGTKAKTGDQLDEDLENIAASVESNMEETSATVSFSALKETSDTAMQIFHDLLTEPEFRQDKLDLVLTQARGGIARRNDEASSIPDRELMRILYGPDTPYGWQLEYEDLDHIKRDDLIAFYKRYYFPKNIMLAVYGDFTVDDMKARLEKLFASWKTEQPPAPPFPAVSAKAAPGMYLAEKADVTQSFFAIGELGGTLRDPDYAATQVAAHILGQGFSSRLVSEIRTRLGYAYSVAAVWSPNYNHPGTFRIVGSTKSASTVDTIQAVNRELEKLRTMEVTDQELKEAKDGVLNAFVFNFDSPAKTLNRVLRYAYFGYPKDFLFQYQKAVSAVTKADVLKAAMDHFRPENLAFVTVGNPASFGKPLTTINAKVNTIDLTIPEPKQAVAAGDSASLARGKALLERAQQAMGGAAALAAIKDATETADMTMEAAAGGMKIHQTSRFIAPDQYRQDQELPFGKIAAYTDGKTGWLSTPQGTGNMPAEVLKQAQGEMFRNLATLMLSTRDASRTVNAVGDNAVQISAGNQTVKIDFDPATGFPSRQTYQETSPQGGPSEVVEAFSDWRDAGAGLKMPFKVSIEQGGKKLGDATVAGYQFNTGLKVEDLSKKP